MGDILKITGLILFICFLLLIGPWLFIWAINTLAAAGGATNFVIPFGFWTWLAAIILGGFSILPVSRRS